MANSTWKMARPHRLVYTWIRLLSIFPWAELPAKNKNDIECGTGRWKTESCPWRRLLQFHTTPLIVTRWKFKKIRVMRIARQHLVAGRYVFGDHFSLSLSAMSLCFALEPFWFFHLVRTIMLCYFRVFAYERPRTNTWEHEWPGYWLVNLA